MENLSSLYQSPALAVHSIHVEGGFALSGSTDDLPIITWSKENPFNFNTDDHDFEF